MNNTPPTSPPTRRVRQRTVLPGFGLSAAITSLMVVSLVVIPLAVLILRAASLGPAGFLAAAWTPRARAAYGVSLGASLAAAMKSGPWPNPLNPSGSVEMLPSPPAGRSAASRRAQASV